VNKVELGVAGTIAVQQINVPNLGSAINTWLEEFADHEVIEIKIVSEFCAIIIYRTI